MNAPTHERDGFTIGLDPYAPRLNRAMDYIDAHLGDALTLEHVARVAAFSEGHFHRIFKAWTHETLSNFIQRRRLEAAAVRLRHNRWDSITQVAQGSGFSSPETFARAFRRRFGMAASSWRKLDWARLGDAQYPDLSRFSSANVVARRFPQYEHIYWRLHGDYRATASPAWQRFLTWLPSVGLDGTALVGTGLDDPSITPPELCRYDTCALLTQAVDWSTIRASRKVSPAGWYACMPFSGTRNEVGAAWHWLLAHWLPTSGFSLGAGPFLEWFAPGGPPLQVNGIIHAELRMPIQP